LIHGVPHTQDVKAGREEPKAHILVSQARTKWDPEGKTEGRTGKDSEKTTGKSVWPLVGSENGKSHRTAGVAPSRGRRAASLSRNFALQQRQKKGKLGKKNLENVRR